MLRPVLLFPLLLLAACDAASSEYPRVGEARSAAAEWAKVNELARHRRLTDTYVATMREEMRSELGTIAGAFADPRSDQAREVAALLALPADAPSAALSAHVEKLKQIEDRLAVS